MRVIQVSTQVQMAADEFWALRLDQNYDDFCAQCDDVTFQLLSRRQEVCDGQTLEFIEPFLAPMNKLKSLPDLSGLAGLAVKYSDTQPRLKAMLQAWDEGGRVTHPFAAA